MHLTRATSTEHTPVVAPPDITADGADRHHALLLARWEKTHTRLRRQVQLVDSVLNGCNWRLVNVETAAMDAILEEFVEQTKPIVEQPVSSESASRVEEAAAAMEETVFAMKMKACDFLKREDAASIRSGSSSGSRRSRSSVGTTHSKRSSASRGSRSSPVGVVCDARSVSTQRNSKVSHHRESLLAKWEKVRIRLERQVELMGNVLQLRNWRQMNSETVTIDMILQKFLDLSKEIAEDPV